MNIDDIITLSTKIQAERDALAPHIERFTGLMVLEDELRKLLGSSNTDRPEPRPATHSMVKNSVQGQMQRAEKREKLFQFLNACTAQTATIDQMVSATGLKRHDITNILWFERNKKTIQHVGHATWRSVIGQSA